MKSWPTKVFAVAVPAAAWRSLLRRAWMAVVIVLAGATAPLFAQVDNGSITGIVRDASGSVLPNAHIEVINIATNVKSEFNTNSDGTYDVLGLIPGVYKVRATSPGFSTGVMDSVRINVQSIAKVDFTLTVGDVKQEVQVSASSELLETQRADVGGVVESRQINELPLNGRNYDQLALLEPGVYANPSGEVANPAEGRFSANGNLELQNYYSLDGIDNNTGSENLQEQSAQAVIPPPDALQEFRLQTRTYSTEFGTSAGAIINASTKSGTNEFHGDVWEYLRNSALDANTFFNNYGGTPKGHFSQNQFGGTAGGPIVRDHAFFFAAYQGLLSSRAQTVYSTVPTPAMKSGDFTALSSSYNLQAVADGQAGCIVNNVVQPACIDPVGQTLINLYPDPNFPNVGAPYTGAPNYKYVTAAPNHTHTIDGRIDEKLNLKNQIFGRYSYNHQNYESPLWTADPDVGNGSFSTEYVLHDQSLALGWTYTPTSSLVNIAHFGFLRDFSQSNPIGLTLGQSNAPKYGLTGIPVTPETAGLPPIYIFGLTTEGSSIYRPQFQVAQVWQFIDDVYKLVGRHSLQFGYEYHENSLNFFDLEAPQGAILATGIYTNTPGFAPADFLLGDIGWAIYETALELNNYIPGNSFYAQDTWRATPKLTVNYGLRYELYPPFWINRNNQTSNFSPANGGEIVSASSSGGLYGRVLIHPDNTNFSPRVGIAYHVVPKVVLRGGFGIFHQFINRIGSESMLQLNPPFLRDDSVQQQLGSTTPVFQLKNGFPSSELSELGIDLPQLQLRAQDPNERTSYVEQASFGPQIQLNGTTVLDAIWVGNWGRKMNRLRNANQGVVTGFSGGSPVVTFPYANLNTVSQAVNGAGQHGFLELGTNDGNTAYNGLEVDIKRQLTHGLAYQVSYTFSHNLADYVDNLTGNAFPQNAYDYEHEMSNSQQDVRSRLVGNAIWALPIGQGGMILNEDTLMSRLIGHWQVNGIASFQTGIPFDVTAPDASFTGGNHQSYPDCTGDPFAGASTNPKDFVGNASGFFINPAAFTNPAPGFFGSCRPRMFHGPGTEDVDLSVFKSFPIKDNWRFEFRAEFFNAFNHPNFANPSASTSSPGAFGKSSATTNDPREIQFAGKIFF
jgi:Carboxypeptidase regulatory-like domain/TonB dependent receptor